MFEFSITHWLAEIRQWGFPREFRIAAGGGNVPTAAIGPVIQALQTAVEQLSNPEAQRRLQDPRSIDDDAFMADLATRLWRIREAMRQPNSEEPVAGAERSHRHVDRFFSRLEEDYHIRVEDKTGDPYDVGMNMLVVTSEPTDGVTREFIKETLLPAVYRGNRLIQQANVIVAAPAAGTVRSASAEKGEKR